MNNILRADLGELAAVIKETVDDGREAQITVVGISMFPLLVGGRDSVVLMRADKVRKYDVIFYRRESGAYVLHRVVGIKDNAYIVCGDNQTIVEYPVKKEWVIAKAKCFYRKGRLIRADGAPQRLYASVWAKLIPWRVKLLTIGGGLRRVLHGKHKK